jgi:hypothetical protein
MRVALAVLSALVLVGAASARGPLTITERDSGKHFTVARHGVATLRLDDGWFWTEPHVSGTAVELSAVEYFVDPGFVEWSVRAVHRGTVQITARGTASGAAPRSLVVTLRVR